jgi:hypothetical protein
MRTRTLLSTSFAALVLLGLTAVPAARAGEPQLECPRYRAALLRAKAALQEGDREAAIAALHSAKEALRSCANAEADGVKLSS